jgi:hypothetical protein
VIAIQVCIAVALSACSTGVTYTKVVVSVDEQLLTITSARGSFPAPATEAPQAGFSKPLISSDGRLVGWLALTQECCTSYPLPTSLIILKNDAVAQRFHEAPPIWAWTFAKRNTAVLYRQEFPHGPPIAFYTLRRISDGKVLRKFTCNPDQPPPRGLRDFPRWALPLAQDCQPDI